MKPGINVFSFRKNIRRLFGGLTCSLAPWLFALVIWMITPLYAGEPGASCDRSESVDAVANEERGDNNEESGDEAGDKKDQGDHENNSLHRSSLQFDQGFNETCPEVFFATNHRLSYLSGQPVVISPDTFNKIREQNAYCPARQYGTEADWTPNAIKAKFDSKKVYDRIDLVTKLFCFFPEKYPDIFAKFFNGQDGSERRVFIWLFCNPADQGRQGYQEKQEVKDQEGRSFINHDYPIYLYQSLDEERRVMCQPEMNYIMTAFRKDLARESLSVSSGLLDQGSWCSMGSLRAKELANAFLKRVEPSTLVSILTWNIDVNQMDSMQKHLWGIYPLNILARVALARALENNDQKGDSGDSHDNGGNKSKDKDALLRDIIRPLMEYGLITQPIDFDCDQQKDQSQKMQNHGANHFDITLSTLDNACGYRLEEYVVSYMTLYLVSRLGGAVKFARFFKDTPISSTGDKDTLAQNALESWQRFITSSAADLETDMKKAFEWISEQDIQEASQLFFSWMDK